MSKRDPRREASNSVLPPLRILSWWLVASAVTVAIAVTLMTTWLLLTKISIGNSTEADIANTRINALKTGLSVGAGAGGAMALLIAARRQWLGERAQAHQEATAQSDILDATERRIADLYSKAVDQLGNGKATVRISGILALERLAQANVEHRQTIVDVICSYLRMPFDVPKGLEQKFGDSSAYRDFFSDEVQRQELQVRITAQEVLRRHLVFGADYPSEDYWSGIRLDLSGASLFNLNLCNCVIHAGQFMHAVFYGTTRLARSRWRQYANFRSTHFYGFTDFEDAVFDGIARFDSSKFHHSASFASVEFMQSARYDGFSIEKMAVFRKSKFWGNCVFDNAAFCSEAVFISMSVEGDSLFSGVTFKASVRFESVKFAGPLVLSKTIFAESCKFKRTRFSGRVRVGRVAFQGATVFDDVLFKRGANFGDVTFSGGVNFCGVRFAENLSFRSTSFKGYASFSLRSKNAGLYFYGASFHAPVTFSGQPRQSQLNFKNCSIDDPRDWLSSPYGVVVSSEKSARGCHEIRNWHIPYIL